MQNLSGLLRGCHECPITARYYRRYIPGMTQYRTGYSTLTASDIVCPSTSTALGIGKAPCNSSNCSASNPKLIQEYSPTAHRIRSLPRVVYVYLDGCHGHVLAAPTRCVRALPDRAAGPRPAWRPDVAQSSTGSRQHRSSGSTSAFPPPPPPPFMAVGGRRAFPQGGRPGPPRLRPRRARPGWVGGGSTAFSPNQHRPMPVLSTDTSTWNSSWYYWNFVKASH